MPKTTIRQSVILTLAALMLTAALVGCSHSAGGGKPAIGVPYAGYHGAPGGSRPAGAPGAPGANKTP